MTKIERDEEAARTQMRQDMIDETKAKREKAVADAQSAKEKARQMTLDTAARIGSVIAVEDVKIAFGNIMNALNGRLHSLPRKISGQLADMDSKVKVQSFLDEQIINVMKELQNMDIDELAKQKGKAADENAVSKVGKTTQKGSRMRKG